MAVITSNAASVPIPVHTQLVDGHPEVAAVYNEAARYDVLSRAYEERFGSKPTYITRAPGRVNLIGEHIDYTLFGVFPAAIERDVVIACGLSTSPDTGEISIQNLDPKYTSQKFVAERDQKGEWQLSIDKTKLRWESYVKAGYYGVLNQFFASPEDGVPRGFNLLVSGSVPSGSGVSSSAAIVVASTLAFLVMNNKLDKVNKGELVTMCMKNETRVGVNSGGMDQAASILSTPQSALYISFFPTLSPHPTPLPPTSPTAVFVIANSLVVSDKLVTSKWNYNLRVVETLAGARILARHLRLDVGQNERITYREVLDRWCKSTSRDASEEGLRGALEAMLASGELDSLKGSGSEQGLTMEEMVERCGVSVEEFEQLYLSFEVEATHFKLYKRAKHVFSEALRVIEFRDLCLAKTPGGDTPLTAEESDQTLRQLGELMNNSHLSCSEDYQCSCPELDDLTKLAREAGAYGSRLTGAGWGGCTVSLVPEPLVASFIEKVKGAYGPYRGLPEAKLQEAIFATKPGNGAFVFELL